MRRNSKVEDEHYDVDSFITLVGAWKLLLVQGTVDAYKYLRSPESILMALEPIGRKMSFSTGADYPTLMSKEVFEALVDTDIDIEGRLTVEEKMYLNYIATYKFNVPRERVLRAICEEKHIDVDECIDTWHIQPDATAMAYGLASPRARTEGITPVIGIPLRTVAPSTDISKIRYPGVVSKYHKNIIHIHRDSEVFEIYDSAGNLQSTKNLEHPETLSKNPGTSYVLEAYIEDNEIIASDILCWNDIWFNRRPLGERLKLLWHFFEITEPIAVVRNRDELDKFKEEFKIVNFRNTNASYDPTAYGGAIKVEGDIETVLLKVAGRRGGRSTAYLVTNDKKVVFEVPVPIDKEDRGDVVEIKRDGSVVKILEDKQLPDGWIELSNKWDYPLNYDDYGKNRVIPKCKWPGDDR